MRILVLVLLLSLPAAAQGGAPAPVGALIQAWGTVEIQDRVVEGPGDSLQGNSLAPPPPSPTGSIDKVPSQMLPWNLAVSGQALLAGATVRTGAQSGALLSLEDGVELQLAESTTLSLGRATQEGLLSVRRGRIWLRTQRPLRLSTPQGELAIKGTELILDAGDTQALLSVMEGSVDVGQVTAGAGKEVLWAAGETPSAPVEAEVQNRRAWVAERTTPEQLSLQPYFATPEEREQARTGAQAEPRPPEASLALARLYLDEGRLAEAARQLQAAPDGPEVRQARARLALLEGRTPEALELLSGLQDVRARVDRGASLWSQASLSEAEKEFRGALEAEPQNPYALAALGYLVEFPQGHYRKAAALLEQAVDLRPGDAALHRQLGDVYTALRRWGAALGQFEEALRLRPEESAQTALRIGTLLIRLGRASEALEYFQRYREQTPSTAADLHYHLAAGYSALAADDLAAAAEHAREAQALAEGRDPALRHLAFDLQGLVLARQRDFDQAATAYGAALALNPGDPFILNDLGVTLRALGEFDEALERLLEARRKAPDSPAVRHNLGRLYILLQQYQRAQSEFEQGLMFAPDDPALLQGLGNTLRFQQRNGPASRLGTQSSVLDPLLIPPRRDLLALLGDFQPEDGPTYVASYSGYRGPVAFLLQGLASRNDTAGGLLPDSPDSASGLAEIGWVASPSDRVFLELGPTGSFATRRREAGVQLGEDYNSLGRTGLHYHREIAAPTDLWLRVQHENVYGQTHNDVRTPDDLRNSESQGDNLYGEIRLDQDLGPLNTVQVGYSRRGSRLHNRSLSFTPVGNSEVARRQDFDQFWLADTQFLGDRTRVAWGLTVDRATSQDRLVLFGAAGQVVSDLVTQAEGSSVNPFLGISSQLSDQTRLSFTVLRQSDIAARAGMVGEGDFSRYLPMTISDTTLLPFFELDQSALLSNNVGELALDLVPGELPFWDYRLRLGHEFSPYVYGTLEAFHTDVRNADFRDTTLFTPAMIALLKGERHRLNGLLANVEFWDGGRFIGRAGYEYRDYRFASAPFAGNRWILVPAHRLRAQVFYLLSNDLNLELSPSFQSGIATDPLGGPTTDGLFRLDAAVHWYLGTTGSRITVGYQNIFQEDRLVEPGPFLNFILALP